LRLYSTSLFIKECRCPLNLFCFAFREMERSDETNSFRQIVEQLVCTSVNRKDKKKKNRERKILRKRGRNCRYKIRLIYRSQEKKKVAFEEGGREEARP
jgi:hypothetical protein